jgi:hypothetical protein
VAITRHRNRPDRQRNDARSTRRRELLEGLVLIAVLVLLAVVARLPAG